MWKLVANFLHRDLSFFEIQAGHNFWRDPLCAAAPRGLIATVRPVGSGHMVFMSRFEPLMACGEVGQMSQRGSNLAPPTSAKGQHSVPAGKHDFPEGSVESAQQMWVRFAQQ